MSTSKQTHSAARKWGRIPSVTGRTTQKVVQSTWSVQGLQHTRQLLGTCGPSLDETADAGKRANNLVLLTCPRAWERKGLARHGPTGKTKHVSKMRYRRFFLGVWLANNTQAMYRLYKLKHGHMSSCPVTSKEETRW